MKEKGKWRKQDINKKVQRIGREKVKKAIRRMMGGKAVGLDNMPAGA